MKTTPKEQSLIKQLRKAIDELNSYWEHYSSYVANVSYRIDRDATEFAQEMMVEEKNG